MIVLGIDTILGNVEFAAPNVPEKQPRGRDMQLRLGREAKCQAQQKRECRSDTQEGGIMLTAR